MNAARIARVVVLATLSLVTCSLLGPRALAASETSPPAVGSSAAPPTVSASAGVPGNLILNGDFESNTFAPPGCHFNLSNASVTAGVASVTAFGAAQEIDVMNDTTSCSFAGPPQSGGTKLALHRNGVGGPSDEFSFALSGPITFGNVYTVSFYAWSDLTFDPDIGAVEIGLSSSASSFGTSVFSGIPTTTGWTLLTTTFVAPTNATHMTVRVDPGGDAWIHVDNFSLVAGGPTPVARRTWGKVKDQYRE